MSQLTLRFLGTFHVTLGGEHLTRFRSANVQGLLVYLILERDRPVPRDVLAALFWPDEPESIARTNLRQTLYQLRKLLSDAKRREPFLLVTRETVQFNHGSSYTLDVDRFAIALENGALRQAVDLYQGDLLPGFACDSLTFEDWLRREREQLHRQALDAMHRLAEEHLTRGRKAVLEAQVIARRQLALEPWREVAHRQLMRALALTGQRGAALAQYEKCVQLLAEELGVPPAPETTALYAAIRDGDFAAELPAEEIEGDDAKKVPNNLPRPLAPFFGRERELEMLETALTEDSVPLLTICGPGGVGKSSLALAAARRLMDLEENSATHPFPDGIYFVALAPLPEVTFIPEAIADALGYRLPEGDLPVQQLHSYLRGKRLLLILDNCEHLAASSAFFHELLAAAPSVTICATSRQPLEIQGEAILPLAGLDPTQESEITARSSAVQLFHQSARRIRLDFDLPEADLPHVARICHLVGGLPLGIQLAASWVDALSPADIAGEIQRDLDFLSTTRIGVPDRQRSMRATFSYTWQLLTPSEREVFARLCVFRGGFTRAAARAATQAPLRLLARLVAKSLVQYSPATDRYDLHELLRQFGAEQLSVNGTAAESRSRHSHYYLQMMADLESALKGRDQKGALAAIAADFTNLRAAWRWAVDNNDVANLAQSLDPLHIYGNLSEYRRRIEKEYHYALDQLPQKNAGRYLRERIRIRVYFWQDETPDFHPVQVEQLLSTFRERDAGREIYLALGVMRAQEIKAGAFARAWELTAAQSEIAQRSGDRFTLATQRIRAGYALLLASRFEHGIEQIRAGLKLSREIGNLYGMAHASLLLGGYAIQVSGEYAAAVAHVEQVVTISRELELGILLNGLVQQSLLSLVRGDFDVCEEQCLAILAEADRQNANRERAFFCQGLLLAIENKIDAAKERLIQVLHMTTNPSVLHATHLGLAVVAFQENHTQHAARMLLRSLDLVSFPPPVPATFIWTLPVAVGLLWRHGRLSRAADLLDQGRAHPACPHGMWDIWSLPIALKTALRSELQDATGRRWEVSEWREEIAALLEELEELAAVGAV